MNRAAAADAAHLRDLGLDIHEWGSEDAHAFGPDAPGSEPMANTQAVGLGLAGGDALGVDLINLAAGQGFAPHTHPGDHLLIVVRGLGTVTWDGRIWPTRPGVVYFVPGLSPHAVGAREDHAILAVGSPHRPVGSPDRQALVAYQAIASTLGRLHCLICDVEDDPARLADRGCTHAPLHADAL